jgi:hypothetical protein
MKYLPHVASLVVLALLLVTTTGCKDKDPKPSTGECTTCQSVMEAKDYFLFKMGLWWVYEEETTHERDSMYVTEANNDPSSYGFDIRIKSALTDYEYHYWPVYYQAISGCSTTMPVHKKCLFVKESKGKIGDFIGESNCFFVEYNEGDFVSAFNVNFENNKVYIDSVYENYSVIDLDFLKTIKTRELAKVQDGNQPTNYYYSRGVGIVRKELLDSNKVWNLVNYYIAP